MANVVLDTRIQIRNDTVANWTTNNPTLLRGEIGVERTTNKFKIGDGATAWNSLPYASATSSVTAAAYPTSSDYGYDIGTIWVGTVATVVKVYVLEAVVSTTATWKQLVTIDDLSSLGAGDMVKATYAPVASITAGKEDYVDKALLADRIGHKLTIGGTEFDGSTAQTVSALPPNGDAGGDLAGTYPNPTIKADVGLTGNPTAPTQDVSNESTRIATTAYVKAKIDQLMAASNAFQFKGTIGTSGTVTELPTTYSVGWTYKVATAGTYAGQVCEVNDQIIATVSRSGSGNLNSDWTTIQGNIDGAVTALNTLVANSVILGNGNKSVKTLTNGSENYILRITGGVPVWSAEIAYTAERGITLVGNKFGHGNAAITPTATGFYKVSVDAYGHITGYTAVQASDITALGIPSADTGITSVVANNGLSQSISGRQLTLGITSISTDLLVQGSNVLIFNGGNA